MKRLFALILLAALVLTVSGCGLIVTDEEKPISPSDLESKINEDILTPPPPLQIPTDDITSKLPLVVPENVFRNDSNNAIDIDAVSIKPKYVYWNSGSLVAECFVINGFSHSVFNIDVKSLSFSNDDGLIASAEFGVLNGATIAPNSYLVWTFSFAPEAVAANNALLSSLVCDYSVNNQY